MKFMGYGAGVRGRRMIAKWGGMGHDVIVGVFDREKKGELLGLPISRYEDGSRSTRHLMHICRRMES